MSNMSYCRFENTFRDLKDCYEHFEDENLSEDEMHYRSKIYDICECIVSEFSDAYSSNYPTEKYRRNS